MNFRKLPSRNFINETRGSREKCFEEESFNRIVSKIQVKDYEIKLRAGRIDQFTPKDFVLYFKAKSIEKGEMYTVSIEKDMATFSRVIKEGYTREDLKGIIDFMFSGECDYLQDKSINVIGSRWINSLLPDSKKWKLGTYIPRAKANKKAKLTVNRNYENKEYGVSIQDW